MLEALTGKSLTASVLDVVIEVTDSSASLHLSFNMVVLEVLDCLPLCDNKPTITKQLETTTSGAFAPAFPIFGQDFWVSLAREGERKISEFMTRVCMVSLLCAATP